MEASPKHTRMHAWPKAAAAKLPWPWRLATAGAM
jgi:hypothetical protein